MHPLNGFQHLNRRYYDQAGSWQLARCDVNIEKGAVCDGSTSIAITARPISWHLAHHVGAAAIRDDMRHVSPHPRKLSLYTMRHANIASFDRTTLVSDGTDSAAEVPDR